jgi:hypothetical protein
MALDTDPASRHATGPYQGLRPYLVEDADYFFGRDRECRLLVANLLAHRLTIVHGESGVGKTSLLAAGVVPALTSSEGRVYAQDPGLLPVYFNAWSSDPLDRVLLHTVAAAIEGTGHAWEPADDLPLAAGLRQAAEHFGGELLLILDQFEEHFQYHESGRFDRELAAAIDDPRLPVNVLLAVRADALSKLEQLRPRLPYLFDNTFVVEHLSASGGRAAITEPLDVYNREAGEAAQVTIDPVLVQQVLAGSRVVRSGQEPTADERLDASHLQLIMTRLWRELEEPGVAAADTEATRVLDSDMLERLGGPGSIIARHLDEVMDGLDVDQQRVAAAAFRQLVTPDRTKIAYSSRDLAWLCTLPQAELDDVLERLAGSRARVLRRVPPAPGQESREPRYEAAHDLVARAMFEWRQAFEQRAEDERLRRRFAREVETQRRRVWARAAVVIVAIAVIAGAALVVLHRELTRSQRDLQVSRAAARSSQQTTADVLQNGLAVATGFRPVRLPAGASTPPGAASAPTRPAVLVFPHGGPYASYRITLEPGPSTPSAIRWGPSRGRGCDASRLYAAARLTWHAPVCHRTDFRWAAVNVVLRGRSTAAQLASFRRRRQMLVRLERYATAITPILAESVRARRGVEAAMSSVHNRGASRDVGAVLMASLIGYRRQILDETLALRAPPGESAMARDLRSSMRLSLAAARSYRSWMLSLPPQWDPAAYGYRTPGYERARSLGREAGVVKSRFLARYDRLAREFGLARFAPSEI